MVVTYLGNTTIPTPAIGTMRFNQSTFQLEMFTGAGWTTVTTVDDLKVEKKIICEDLTFGSLTFYKVVTEGYDFDQLNEWCNQTFGPPRTGPDSKNEHKWFLSGGEIYFHEAKYREWFVLRWSSDGSNNQ